MLSLSPETLIFALSRGDEPTVSLTLRNTSKVDQFAFKVKTTQPKRYLVRPNQGLIDVDQVGGFFCNFFVAFSLSLIVLDGINYASFAGSTYFDNSPKEGVRGTDVYIWEGS